MIKVEPNTTYKETEMLEYSGATLELDFFRAKIPHEYHWVQTYCTYSYYEYTKKLMYRNIGMIISRVRKKDYKPKAEFTKKLRMFK